MTSIADNYLPVYTVVADTSSIPVPAAAGCSIIAKSLIGKAQLAWTKNVICCCPFASSRAILNRISLFLHSRSRETVCSFCIDEICVLY